MGRLAACIAAGIGIVCLLLGLASRYPVVTYGRKKWWTIWHLVRNGSSTMHETVVRNGPSPVHPTLVGSSAPTSLPNVVTAAARTASDTVNGKRSPATKSDLQASPVAEPLKPPRGGSRPPNTTGPLASQPASPAPSLRPSLPVVANITANEHAALPPQPAEQTVSNRMESRNRRPGHKRGKKGTAHIKDSPSANATAGTPPDAPGLLTRHSVCAPSLNATDCPALCPDASPPVYYFRLADPERLIIWLQGGGFCGTHVVKGCFWGPCDNFRWSTSWTQPQYNVNDHHQGRFLLRSDGPFADWSMAYVIYCDGASFSGNRSRPVEAEGVRGGRKLFYLQGSAILRSILQHLVQRRGLHAVREVIFGGTSAGGFAVVRHCNPVGQRLFQWLPSLARFSCIVESGVFLDMPTPANEPVMRSCFHTLLRQHEAGPPGPCSPSDPSSPECFMPQYAVPRIRYPFFVLQNVYDTWQAKFLGHKQLCAKVHRFHAQVLQVLGATQPPNGLFTLGCWSHSIPQSAYKAVAGEVFQWYARNKTVHVFAPPFPKDRLCATGKHKPKGLC